MLGTVLSYLLKHPGSAVKAITTDPLESWTMLQDRFAERRERRLPKRRYEADPDWEHRLHRLLGLEWPCEARSQFQRLWLDVIESLTTRGIRIGPESFNQFNDGDPGLARAVWCLVNHLRPENIVETGVARGIVSRIVLEALERNAAGRLFSIDLMPLNPVLQLQVGIAVGDRLKDRWTYIRGSSRRRLPGLLSRLGQIDLFIHDSLHTQRNTRFELDHAWAALRPGGALVVDDVDLNGAFHSFKSVNAGHPALVCEAEPLSPDFRRFNQKGLFGVMLKRAG